jgi:hypothetical protein
MRTKKPSLKSEKALVAAVSAEVSLIFVFMSGTASAESGKGLSYGLAGDAAGAEVKKQTVLSNVT